MAAVVNGIDTEILNKEVIDKLRDNPAAWIKTFKSEISWIDGTKVSAKMRGKSYEVVSNCVYPGNNCFIGSIPSPVDLLLAGVGSCTAIGYAAFGAVMGIKIEDVRVEIEGTLDVRGLYGLDENVRSGFSELKIKVHIKSDATDEQLEELKKTVESRATVAETVMNGAKIKTELVRM